MQEPAKDAPLIQLAQAVHRCILKPIWNGVFTIANRIADEFQKSTDANHVLGRHGWPPLAFDGFRLKEEIATLRGIDDPAFQSREVERVMLAYHGPARLQNLLADWERHAFIEPHLPALREVIASHNDQRHWVTTTTMYAQIEGVLARAFAFKGRAKSPDVNAAFEAMAQTPYRSTGDLVAMAFWKDILRSQFAFGEADSQRAGRHDVLHGANLTYGTEAISLKAILFFDYLQRALFDAHLLQDGYIHRPGCPNLHFQGAYEFVRNHLFLYMNPRARGVEPGPVCQPTLASTLPGYPTTLTKSSFV